MVALPAPARAATPSTVKPAKPPSRRIWYAAFRMAFREVLERGRPGVRTAGRLRFGLMGQGRWTGQRSIFRALHGHADIRSELVADAGHDAVVGLRGGLVRRLAVVAVVVRQVQREVLEDVPAQGDVELRAPAVGFGEAGQQAERGDHAGLGIREPENVPFGVDHALDALVRGRLTRYP